MKTKTESNRMYSLVVLYNMHTKYFKNVLEGVSDEDAHNRLNTKANHIAWLAGSLVQERYELANELGVEEKPVANALFKNHQGIQANVTYPSLSDFKKDWGNISPILRQALVNVGDEKLNSIFKMEGMEFPYFDYITFQTYREANCIGQIALYRRLLGYDAMKYD